MSVDSLPTGCVLDVEGALARFGGDKQLFVEMATFVLEDAPGLYSDLGGAVQEQDASAIHRKAHALKGLVAGCGGVRAASAAQKVETAGGSTDLTRIDSLVAVLGKELERLRQALVAYCG